MDLIGCFRGKLVYFPQQCSGRQCHGTCILELYWLDLVAKTLPFQSAYFKKNIFVVWLQVEKTWHNHRAVQPSMDFVCTRFYARLVSHIGCISCWCFFHVNPKSFSCFRARWCLTVYLTKQPLRGWFLFHGWFLAPDLRLPAPAPCKHDWICNWFAWISLLFWFKWRNEFLVKCESIY